MTSLTNCYAFIIFHVCCREKWEEGALCMPLDFLNEKQNGNQMNIACRSKLDLKDSTE